jgi:glycerol-3-phosphate cytidylyltransferase
LYNNLKQVNKIKAAEIYKFNKMFVGDDWRGSEKFNDLEVSLAKLNIDLVYFPYTKGTSSSKINKILNDYKFSD